MTNTAVGHDVVGIPSGPDGWLLVRQRVGVWWTEDEDTLKAFG